LLAGFIGFAGFFRGAIWVIARQVAERYTIPSDEHNFGLGKNAIRNTRLRVSCVHVAKPTFALQYLMSM